MQRGRVVNNLWNLEPATEEPAAADDASSLPQPSSEEPAQQPAAQQDEPAEDATVDSVTSSLFISRFKEAVEARLADSDLSIEELAADMSLSRVQLYRKVKNITGSSPVELLRTARLNRGYQLLLTTDKTISEVAYAVGFTAPSYFTKCFKDEFGMLPGDVRTQ
jgi:AraC-like DNA-binding protein